MQSHIRVALAIAAATMASAEAGTAVPTRMSMPMPVPVPVPVPQYQITSSLPAAPAAVAVLPSDETETYDSAQESSVLAHDILNVDENMLLTHPAVLRRAMISALRSGHVQAMLALLPVYEKSEARDNLVLAYVRAIKAHADGDHRAVAVLLRKVLTQQPQAHAVRAQLAEALLAAGDDFAAREQLALLSLADLDESLESRLVTYRAVLDARGRWRLQASVSLIDDDNINQAPRIRRDGNWVFEAPVHDRGLGYHASAEKSWKLKQGLDARLRTDAHGRYYLRHGRYNDTIVRAMPALGVSDQRFSSSIGPFLQYRRFGNQIHARSAGIRIEYNAFLTPRIQSFTTLETGRRYHTERYHLDNNHLSFNALLRYRHRPMERWLLAHDLHREWGARDASDTFTHYGLRAAWERQWPAGVGLQLVVTGSLRNYQGPTLLSGGTPRRDHHHSVAMSVWHDNLAIGRLTPRLTLSRSQSSSNDIRINYRKTRLMLEASATF